MSQFFKLNLLAFKKCLAGFVLLTSNLLIAGSLTENGDFQKWGEIPAVPRWSLEKNLFPTGWAPIEQEKEESTLTKKTEGGRHSVYLNGRMLSQIVYSGAKGKTFSVTVRAKGQKGKLNVYLREYNNETSKLLDYVAIAIESETESEWREYRGEVEMTPYHGADAAQLEVVGKNIQIESIHAEEKSVEAAIVKKPFKGSCAIPLTHQAPVIDGQYTPSEWAESVGFCGLFMDIKTGLAISVQPECKIASDNKNIYLLVLMPTPLAELTSNGKNHDDDVFLDDSIEVYINPDHSMSKKNVIYQLISNFKGVSFDLMNNQAIGQNDRGWTCQGLTVKAGEFKGNALLEISFPGESVGLKSLEKEWGLNLGINLGASRNASITGRAFNDFLSMLSCRVDAGAPSLNWSYSGERSQGRFILDAELLNKSSKSESYRATLRLSSTTNKELARDLVLPPGGSDRLKQDLSQEVHDSGAISCAILSKEGKTFFSHETEFKKTEFKSDLREVKKGKQFKTEYFPTLKKFNIRIFPLTEEERALYKKGEIKITGPDGKGKTIKCENPVFVNEVAHFTFPIDTTVVGVYKIQAAIQGKDGNSLQTIETTVEGKKFEWVGNSIGKDRVIVPPFTAMKYGESSISCLGREHQIGKGGLPDQILVAEKPILASPIALVLEEMNGEKPSPKVKLVMGSKEADRCEFKSQLLYPNLEVNLDAWMEYDGCLFYKMDLKPMGNSCEIKSFSLEIPLLDPVLMHAVADAIRQNSVSAFLKKEDGVIWSSKKIKNTILQGHFIPFIWAGRSEAGLSWFAESDRGWKIKNEKPNIEMIRKGSTTVMKVNFIAEKGLLKDPRHIEFGLMATPTKPRVTGANTNKEAQYVASFGGFFNDELTSMDPFLSKLLLKNILNEKRSFHIYTCGNQYPLSDPEFNYYLDELQFEPQMLFDQYLEGKKFKLLGDVTERYINTQVCWTPERVDFNLHKINLLQKELKVPGVYLDNSYPFFNKNIHHPKGAYLREDGTLQAGCNLLDVRDYLKRCATLSYLNKMQSPRVSVHCTDAMMISCFAFADTALSGEMTVPEEADHMDVFNLATSEVMLGVHWGPTPGSLTMMSSGDPAKLTKRTRSMLAMFKMYDMTIYPNSAYDVALVEKLTSIEADFGASAGDSQFISYADDRSKVMNQNGGSKIKTSFFVRPKLGALIYVTNIDRETKEIILKPDLKTFNLENQVLYDAETGTALECQNGEYKLSVEKRDFRVLRTRASGSVPAKP